MNKWSSGIYSVIMFKVEEGIVRETSFDKKKKKMDRHWNTAKEESAVKMAVWR